MLFQAGMTKATPTAVEDRVYFFRCLGTRSSIQAETTPTAPPINSPDCAPRGQGIQPLCEHGSRCRP
jgi:hypothetical protein